MVSVRFPEISLPEGLIRGEPVSHPRDRIANPKAVAAQTFCAPALQLAYQESGVWRDLAPFFQRQHAIEALDLPAGPGEGIAFPWAVSPDAGEGDCAVWIERGPVMNHVRHVRLYARQEEAREANAILLKIIQSAFPGAGG